MIKEIISQREYPNVTELNNGDVAQKENWNDRRKEMLELLETYSYGKTP